MIAMLITCLVVSGSIVIVAFAWNRIRGLPVAASMPPGLRSAVCFAGGPFSISIAIHLVVILGLIIAVHESRARDLIIVTMEPGSLHPFEGVEPLEMPDVGFPDVSTKSPDDSPPVVDVDKVFKGSSAIAGTSSDRGIDLGRHIDNYLNLRPGPGGEGGVNFPGFIGDLRRKGLDIVLVIDGTKSMDFVM